MVSMPGSVIQQFLLPSGYASMTPAERRSFLADNLHAQTLRKAVAKSARDMGMQASRISEEKIQSFQSQQKLLGLIGNASDWIDIEGRWIEDENTTSSSPSSSFSLWDRIWESFLRRNERLPDHPNRGGSIGKVARGLSDFFGRKGGGRPANAASGGSLSIAFLFLIVVVLWVGFARVKSANGPTTTRLKLLGSVVSGNATL